MRTVVCLGEDSVPVQITLGKSGGIKVTYSEWNKPVSIAAPADAVEWQQEEMPEGASPHGGMGTPHGTPSPHGEPRKK